jgi:hypothetical protein
MLLSLIVDAGTPRLCGRQWQIRFARVLLALCDEIV